MLEFVKRGWAAIRKACVSKPLKLKTGKWGRLGKGLSAIRILGLITKHLVEHPSSHQHHLGHIMDYERAERDEKKRLKKEKKKAKKHKKNKKAKKRARQVGFLSLELVILLNSNFEYRSQLS